MKKPILLVVDDEPAVLSALEAELTQGFGQIARIEAFDDARQALEALPRWSREGRAVAVAIVDQRMPGMTGVELLRAIRASSAAADGAFHSARHMRAVLLTGYAGLDSALAALNEANIDRYLEKPWSPEVLSAQLRRLLSRHIIESGADRYIEFREITTVDEIRRYLSLRFEIYSASSNLRPLLPRYSKRKLDLDAYDTQSRFYSMFLSGLEDTEQIGGLRLIGTSSPNTERAVVLIANEDDSLRERAAKRTEFAIELPEKWPEPEAILALLDQLRKRGEVAVEASRLVILPAQRGRSLGAGQVILGMFEGATAYVLEVLGIENVLQNCAVGHRAAAERLGFRLAEGTRPIWSRRMGETMVALHGRASHLTDEARQRIRSVGAGIAARGGACRCSSFPHCVGTPYETGDFAAVDCFCPLRARTVLSGTAPVEPIHLGTP